MHQQLAAGPALTIGEGCHIVCRGLQERLDDGQASAAALLRMELRRMDLPLDSYSLSLVPNSIPLRCCLVAQGHAHSCDVFAIYDHFMTLSPPLQILAILQRAMLVEVMVVEYRGCPQAKMLFAKLRG